MSITIRASELFTEFEFATPDGPHIEFLTATEAYALATHLEWLLEDSGREEPTSSADLPDNVAFALDFEPCTDCGSGVEHEVICVATALDGDRTRVHVVEVRHPEDFRSLYHFLMAAAVAITETA